MKNIKRFLALVLVMLSLTAGALASAHANVLSSKMNVYFAPSASSECIGSLKCGAGFTVDAVKGDWARISYKGRVGYARIQDMVCTDSVVRHEVTKTSKVKYITRNNRKVRTMTLNAGTSVYIRGWKGDYYLVSDKKLSVLAYVKKSYVK